MRKHSLKITAAILALGLSIGGLSIAIANRGDAVPVEAAEGAAYELSNLDNAQLRSLCLGNTYENWSYEKGRGIYLTSFEINASYANQNYINLIYTPTNRKMTSLSFYVDYEQLKTSYTATVSWSISCGGTLASGSGTSGSISQTVSLTGKTSNLVISLSVPANSDKHYEGAKFTNLSCKMNGYHLSTVTLNRNGGSGGTSSVTAQNTATMPSITKPTRSGYNFLGYYDATSGGTQYYTSTGASARVWDKQDATATLYAQWEVAEQTVNITPGTGISSAYLSTSSTATSGSASGSKFNYNATVYGFVVLKEGYNAQSNWTYISGGSGENTAGAIYRVGSKTVGTSTVDFGTQNATIKTLVLNVYKNNGTSQYDQYKLTYGEAKTLTAFTRSCYSFGGLNVNSDGTGDSYTTSLSVADVNALVLAGTSSLYAQWTFVPADLVALIDAIGTVSYPDSRSQLLAAEKIFNELSDSDKEGFIADTESGGAEAYIALVAARSEYDSQRDDAVAAVKEAIDAIGTVSYPESKALIVEAETLYAALAPEEKNETTIDNYSTLTSARTEYDSQRDDAVLLTTQAIDAISNPFDDDREEQISTARALYDALDSDQKNLTWIVNYQDLLDAEAADEVADMIEALIPADTDEYRNAVLEARNAYTALTDDQKNYINASLIKMLTDDEETIVVMDIINEIGDVEYTSESKSLIDIANAAYEALDEDQKILVANYDTLAQANVDYDNVDNGVTKITNIGTVEYSEDCKALIDEARTTYDALSDYQKEIFPVETLKALEDAEAAWNAMDLINAIGDINEDSSRDRIDEAREAYDALTDDQKALVDSYPEFEETLVNDEAARDFVEKIETIGELAPTDEAREKVDSSREAYDALSDDQKALVDDSFVKILTDDEEALHVMELIKSIGEVTYDGGNEDSLEGIVAAEAAYDALTDDQKALVDKVNHADLTHDREIYDNVDEAADLIAAIGDVEYSEESKELIDAARAAYDALTDEEKALVDGYDDSYVTLDDAEHVYTALEHIENIGEVSYDSESEEAIEEARAYYDSLTDEQKEQVGETALETLTKKETTYAEMKKTGDGLLIAMLIVASLILLGGIFFLFFIIFKKRKKDDDEDNGQGGPSSKKKAVKVASIAPLAPFVMWTSHYLDTPYIALYIIAGLAVLIWIAVPIVHFAKKRHKAKVAASKKEEAVKPLTKDEEETAYVRDEQGNLFQIRFIKSFSAKLIQAEDEAKGYYEELRNYVLSYKKTNSRISWHYEAINSGRNPVLKFAVRGKTLCLYFPLQGESLDPKYKVESIDSRKFEDTPILYRIKNDRRCKYAKELIDLVMGKLGLAKGEERKEAYDIPYEPNRPLIERGLIKELKVKATSKAEPFKAVKDEDEPIIVKDEQGNLFEIRYIKSFAAKLSQADDEAKGYYSVLKNHALSFKKANSRVSWHYDSITVSGNPIAKFAIRGKTLCVYLPLKAEELEGKYKVEEAKGRKYEDTPVLYRIKNERRLGYAKNLMDIVASRIGAEKGKEFDDEYAIPYEDNETLLAKGLIKESKIAYKGKKAE